MSKADVQCVSPMPQRPCLQPAAVIFWSEYQGVAFVPFHQTLVPSFQTKYLYEVHQALIFKMHMNWLLMCHSAVSNSVLVSGENTMPFLEVTCGHEVVSNFVHIWRQAAGTMQAICPLENMKQGHKGPCQSAPHGLSRMASVFLFLTLPLFIIIVFNEPQSISYIDL